MGRLLDLGSDDRVGYAASDTRLYDKAYIQSDRQQEEEE